MITDPQVLEMLRLGATIAGIYLIIFFFTTFLSRRRASSNSLVWFVVALAIVLIYLFFTPNPQIPFFNDPTPQPTALPLP